MADCLPSECTVDGCLRPARRGGLCWGHTKRHQRNMPGTDLLERGQSPKRVLLEAIWDLVEVDASDKQAWRKAWDRVRKAAVRYVKADKPSNPYRNGRQPRSSTPS
ncbi:hypothetical protein [Myxococcus landrumensis]|uniref:Transposase n=1 Tax=Myxococcus landrumensis TaxID=2813577 RepID=A0ABX7N6G3_9BACT|nr:hypothetical protein [Myxococcus landrumus]QSQ14061.1 hypothetical protein JY572_38065 [Myxococcus landrumus]